MCTVLIRIQIRKYLYTRTRFIICYIIRVVWNYLHFRLQSFPISKYQKKENSLLSEFSVLSFLTDRNVKLWFLMCYKPKLKYLFKKEIGSLIFEPLILKIIFFTRIIHAIHIVPIHTIHVVAHGLGAAHSPSLVVYSGSIKWKRCCPSSS